MKTNTSPTRKKLIKNVKDEILRIKEEKGVDILKMPDIEMSRWVEYLVRRFNK
jgi:hypothetical protein